MANRGLGMRALGVGLTLGLLVACSADVRAAIVIDDLSASAPGVSRYFSTDGAPAWATFNPRLDTSTNGVTLGGQRDVYLGVPSSAGTARIDSFGAVLQGGKFDVTTGAPGTVTILQYDGNDTELGSMLNNAALLGGVNLTAGGNDRFEFSFNRVDPSAMDTTLDLRIIVNGTDGLTHNTTIERTAVPRSYQIPFTALGPTWSSVLSNVSSLEFQFNPGAKADVDFELTSIGATSVPEPGTAGALAAGVTTALGVWLCRRAQRRLKAAQ